jgi:hypothetical protein
LEANQKISTARLIRACADIVAKPKAAIAPGGHNFSAFVGYQAFLVMLKPSPCHPVTMMRS